MSAATRILVIDDEPDFSALFKENLEESGNYSVETETDPTKAPARRRQSSLPASVR